MDVNKVISDLGQSLDKHPTAFPFVVNIDNRHILSCGLTKREFFAAMAMQGILAHDRRGTDLTVSMAVTTADALIKELAK